MKQKRRPALTIMRNLITLVKPLVPVMCLAVILGVSGYLCAIFLSVNAVRILLQLIRDPGMAAGRLYGALILMAVSRGLLHYGEQYCNHYIAFRLLALIRHKVFAALRRLCPAKLDGRDKGNLISIITSDIELLEVFYAHTISPILIALIVSVIMVFWIGSRDPAAGICAAFAYLLVGAVIPVINGRTGADAGLRYRNKLGELNSYVLDHLRGLDETIRFGRGRTVSREITNRSLELGRVQKTLNRYETIRLSITDLVILLFSFGVIVLMMYRVITGVIGFEDGVLAAVALMSSFGPVSALSALSGNLNQTLAGGERVLSLLEEEPAVAEKTEGETPVFAGAAMENVSFAYESENILKDYSLSVPEGTIIGIHGPSGSGKSTILKLLMRFYDADSGTVSISSTPISEIKTSCLRDQESYVTQETWLFHDTIANNIAVGKPGASLEEIKQAARKAGISEFIESLEQGYDTMVGELGDTLSGGERQRIGLARAFLHDAPFILLDEPTSNLDALNEGMIVRTLKEEAKDRTVVLVSHRASTMNAANVIVEMNPEHAG